MPNNDYWKLSAHESAKLIRDGSISAEDLVSSCIERTKETNNKINAIVDDLSVPALERARELDKHAKKGAFKGPLHGVPITIKENATDIVIFTSSVRKFLSFIRELSSPPSWKCS